MCNYLFFNSFCFFQITICHLLQGQYNYDYVKRQTQSNIRFQVLNYKFPRALFDDIGSFEVSTGRFEWKEDRKTYFKNGEFLERYMTYFKTQRSSQNALLVCEHQYNQRSVCFDLKISMSNYY